MSEQELLEAVGCHPSLSQDLSLREALKNKPQETLGQLFPNLDLASSIKIYVHENTPSTMHLILINEHENVGDLTFDAEDSLEVVLEKALMDEGFRQQLIKDPHKLLAQELEDYYIPEDFKIFFHENKADQIHLLLPNLDDEPEEELSEDELRKIVGGAPPGKGKRHKGPHVGRKRGRRGPRCRKRLFFR